MPSKVALLVPRSKGLPAMCVAAIGCIALPLVAVAATLAIGWFFPRGRHAPGSNCRINLLQLRSVCEAYERKFGVDAPSLRALYESGLAGHDGMLFVCPIRGSGRMVLPRNPARGEPWSTFEKHVNYEYRPPPDSAKGHVSPDYVLAWDSSPHADGMRVVLYYVRRIGYLDEAEFQAAIKAAP